MSRKLLSALFFLMIGSSADTANSGHSLRTIVKIAINIAEIQGVISTHVVFPDECRESGKNIWNLTQKKWLRGQLSTLSSKGTEWRYEEMVLCGVIHLKYYCKNGRFPSDARSPFDIKAQNILEKRCINAISDRKDRIQERNQKRFNKKLEPIIKSVVETINVNTKKALGIPEGEARIPECKYCSCCSSDADADADTDADADADTDADADADTDADADADADTDADADADTDADAIVIDCRRYKGRYKSDPFVVREGDDLNHILGCFTEWEIGSGSISRLAKKCWNKGDVNMVGPMVGPDCRGEKVDQEKERARRRRVQREKGLPARMLLQCDEIHIEECLKRR